jgi:hypothetical protein
MDTPPTTPLPDALTQQRILGLDPQAAQQAGLGPTADPAEAWAWLAQWLQPRVEALLRGEFSTLVQGLYRLDVPEAALQRAMAEPSLTEAAAALTQAILLREQQRQQSRQAFRQQHPDATPE